MSRNTDISETGAYGIQDNDVNTDGVWSNEETGRTPMAGGSVTVGTEVATTAFKDAHDTEGGVVVGDVGVEAQVSRRESRRAPRGFDDPEMNAQSYTLATQERIEGEAEADRESDATAERFEAVRREADAETDGEAAPIEGRAARCREEVTSDTYYQNTTSDETPETTTNDNPFDDLTQDQLADVNQMAARLDDRFEVGTALSRASFSKMLARRVADGESALDALLAVKEAVQKFPDTIQPIAEIDPFDQYQTTVRGTIDVLWQPKGEGQYQVGLISDETNEPVKITVWRAAGDKPLLREGDTVEVNRAKVNAYQRDGEWETTLAVDAECEIHHIEHGDGDAPRSGRQSDNPTVPAWSADSDTHAWVSDVDMERAVEVTTRE
jgi:hypothetical protein